MRKTFCIRIFLLALAIVGLLASSYFAYFDIVNLIYLSQTHPWKDLLYNYLSLSCTIISIVFEILYVDFLTKNGFFKTVRNVGYVSIENIKNFIDKRKTQKRINQKTKLQEKLNKLNNEENE